MRFAVAEAMPSFPRPSTLERAFNRLFGLLVGLGIGLSHNYLLKVRGRKSGRIYSTPVNLLLVDGRKYLIAPRGNTQWVRNARSSGEVWLKRGRRQKHFRVKEVQDEEKPQILKLYLDQFHTTVQRYFSIPAGSSLESFVGIATQYPTFELESVED